MIESSVCIFSVEWPSGQPSHIISSSEMEEERSPGKTL